MLKASVFIESLILFFVILCCFFVALPLAIKTNQQERNIVKWEKNFSNMKYAFEILKVQSDSPVEGFISSESQNKLKQILREKAVINNTYNINFLNDNMAKETYVFNKFFENEHGNIIGFKWINPKCRINEICAVISVDINGFKKPNKWGRDVYGIDLYREGIEPSGSRKSFNELRKDCSRNGSGVYCSAYFLIGGLIVR